MILVARYTAIVALVMLVNSIAVAEQPASAAPDDLGTPWGESPILNPAFHWGVSMRFVLDEPIDRRRVVQIEHERAAEQNRLPGDVSVERLPMVLPNELSQRVTGLPLYQPNPERHDTSISLANYLDSERPTEPQASKFSTYALPPVPTSKTPNPAYLDLLEFDELETESIASASSWMSEPDFDWPEIIVPERNELALRLGGWMTESSGSPTKVGEYQSLQSSLFADFDGLFTDGVRTYDFHGTILDQDASSVALRALGPQTSATIEYERYLRRLDVERFDGYVDFDQQPPLPLPAPPQNFRDMREDLTVGEDFAIRVEELDSSIQGKLTDNSRWKLNVWAMRKHGERQATAMAHCFTATNATDTNGAPVGGVACHQLSQIQRIDWRTTQLEPVIEGNFGPVQAEYSHTIRALSTSDQLVTRPYDGLGITGNQPYGMVPENMTHIDRLKLGLKLPDRRSAYARLFSGNTENEFRETNRRFRGFDVRLTDRSFDGLTLTTYARKYVQSGQNPAFLVPFESFAGIRSPINYDRTNAGIDSTWRPFMGAGGWHRNLRLTCGYQYRELQRENAVFTEQGTTVDQSATQTHNVHFRSTVNWTPAWTTSAQYKISFIDDPLFAISTNATTNSSLPTQAHHVDFQSNWTPSGRFSLTGLVRVLNRWNSSDVASFDEDNYDLVFTAWYAPTSRWSFVTSWAFYSNWIDQDITLGTRTGPLVSQWEYGGDSDVIHLSTNYAWTPRMTLTAGVNFVNAKNVFDPLTPWPDLSGYSDVNVETTRFLGGLDIELSRRASAYLRYQLFDYEDLAAGLDSGRVEMLLLGGSLIY